MKNRNIAPLINTLVPTFVTIAYLLLGFCFDRGWAVGWILFLLIPITSTLINAINTKNPSHFAYPVFLAAIFLSIGMIGGVWHPTWLIFITIPAYYSICNALKRSKAPAQVQYAPDGTPVPVNDAYLNNGGRTTVIVSSIICGVLLVAVIVVCIFAGNGKIDFGNKTDPSAISTDSASIAASDLDKLEIEWVSGNVQIEYYDGTDIKISQSGSTSLRDQMTYSIKGKLLSVTQGTSNVIIPFISSPNKSDLLVMLPNSFEADKISIDVVTAEVRATGLKTEELEVDTVSGELDLSFAAQPDSIECDSVSGDVDIVLPADFTGYSVSFDSVSGTFSASDFGNATTYGDAAVVIDADSVSGSLSVGK